MTWFIIKGLLILFPLFVFTGTIGNFFGWLFFKISKSLKSDWLLVVSSLFLIVFSIACFSFMGLFYASFAYALKTYMRLWLAIIIISPFIAYVYIHTVKEYMKLKEKLDSDPFIIKPRNSEYHTRNLVNTKIILSSGHFMPISFILFLIFNDLADKVSFGLNSHIISLIK